MHHSSQFITVLEPLHCVRAAGNEYLFWGENLMGAREHPVKLPGHQTKLAYSPHVYGPDKDPMAYFKPGNFVERMPSIWQRHFGFVAEQGTPVVIGELGSWYKDTKAALYYIIFRYLVLATNQRRHS